MRNPLITLSLTALLSSAVFTSHAAQECLGCLTFSVPNVNNFEWAVGLKTTGFPAFKNEVYTAKSDWYYDNLFITLTSDSLLEDFNYRFTNYEIDRRIRVNEITKELRITKGLLDELTEKKKIQQKEIAQGKKFKHYEIISDEILQDYKSDAENLQQQLDYLAKHPVTKVPLAYPDAFTVYNDTAYFWRNDRIYTFSNTDRKANLTLDQLNQRMAPFSTRQLGKIPHGLGYCFPYGFMQDNGTADYEIKNAFRFKDQPNVLYALYTGTVRHQKLDWLTEAKYSKEYSVAKHGISIESTRLPINQGYQYRRTYNTHTLNLGELGDIELTSELIKGTNPDKSKPTLTGYIIYGALRDTMEPKIADPSKPYIGLQIIGYPKNTGEDYNLPNDPPSPEQAIEKLKPLLKTLSLSLQASSPHSQSITLPKSE